MKLLMEETIATARRILLMTLSILLLVFLSLTTTIIVSVTSYSGNSIVSKYALAILASSQAILALLSLELVVEIKNLIQLLRYTISRGQL